MVTKMNNLNEKFSNSLMDYVEAWFDYHPEPWNIELFEFPESYNDGVVINVYTAEQVLDTFMIKLTFPTAKKAVKASKYLYEVTRIMGITLILINRNLFLFTDRRF
jgi:hypothetical protein